MTQFNVGDKGESQMSDLQQIVSTVADPADRWETRRQHPVGATQRKVLDALGITANNYGHAEAIFEALGIEVTHVRAGRHFIPVVAPLPTTGGGFNQHGEGETWKVFRPEVVLDALSEWIEGGDRG